MPEEKHNQYYLDWLAKQEAQKREQDWANGYLKRLESLKLEAQDLSEVSLRALRDYGMTERIGEAELTRMMQDLGFVLDASGNKYTRATSSRELIKLPPSKIDTPASPPPKVITTDNIPIPQKSSKHLSDDPNTGTDNSA
jgi:hypothetical protein